MMITLLKIISFYLAVIVLISITFIFSNLSNKFGTNLTLFLWLVYCCIPLFTLSFITGVHKLRLWSKAETTGPSILIFLGHLGPAHAIYYYIQMAKAGYGSGVVFIPSMWWVFIFYGIGAFWCISRVATVKFENNNVNESIN